MICFIKNNIELIIVLLAFIVALLAFIVTLTAIRHQIVTLILSQLREKAKESNEYLNEKLQIDNDLITVSGILSTIITAKQIMNIHKKRYSVWLLFYGKQSLIDNFHLQLHTSIRVWIRTIIYSDFPFSDITIKKQLKESKLFLKKSIEKYDK